MYLYTLETDARVLILYSTFAPPGFRVFLSWDRELVARTADASMPLLEIASEGGGLEHLEGRLSGALQPTRPNRWRKMYNGNLWIAIMRGGATVYGLAVAWRSAINLRWWCPANYSTFS